MIYNGFDTPVPVKKGDETEKRKQEEKDLENEERFSDLELKRFMEAPSKENSVTKLSATNKKSPAGNLLTGCFCRIDL